MSEMNLEFLLGVMPPAEARLYRVLIQLIPAPTAESTIAASRQIEMQELAKFTGFSKRWVIELLQRLEEKDFIRTEGGSGALKWIRLLPLGVPLLGGSKAEQPTQEEATGLAPSPGKTKAPEIAASQPKRRRKELAPSPKPVTEVNVAPPVEKPAEIPARRQEVPLPSISPAEPAPGNPAPAASNPVVPAAMVAPPPSMAPGGPAVGNPVVPAAIVALSSMAPGGPAASNPVAPAARVTLPPLTGPAAPAVPAKPVSRRSTKKLPARSHWESASIEKMVAYACSLPVTPDLIYSLKTPGMTGGLLLLALERLCQQIERNERKPYPDRSSLVTALRTILSDL